MNHLVCACNIRHVIVAWYVVICGIQDPPVSIYVYLLYIVYTRVLLCVATSTEIIVKTYQNLGDAWAAVTMMGQCTMGDRCTPAVFLCNHAATPTNSHHSAFTIMSHAYDHHHSQAWYNR